MDYEAWRDAIFGTTDEFDPVMDDLPEAAYELTPALLLGHIDRALGDQEVHDQFTERQIEVGLQLLFNNSCSDFPFAYVESDDDSEGDPVPEARRVAAIKRLSKLYEGFYERYCRSPVQAIGHSVGSLEQSCYMFWDVFVLMPSGESEAVISAALEVMAGALESTNDQVLVSAIHGLGHWVSGASGAKPILESWLEKPTTANGVIIQYCKQAMTGCIQ